MTDKQVIAETERRMGATLQDARHKLAAVRTGRASLSMFDAVMVDYYGTMTPLNQVAKLSVPDPSMVVAQPFDPSALPAIEKAILAADLGLNPANDGKLVRIPIPSLTEERRKQLVKKVNSLGEEAKTAVRLLRREANEEIKALQKEASLAEDDARRATDEIQKKTDKYVADIDALCKNKEKELMEV
jgi:ribosome recycling factor